MIEFSPPFINEEVINEVLDSLNSGWITTGPKVRKLEEELGSFINKPKVLCVNSWTSGAILILRWLGIKNGDEVIIPAYTYSATALAVIHAGGKPVMVDVGDDFNLCVNAVEKAITSKTKAIIPVDFAGLPCDYNGLYKVISKKTITSLFNPNSDIQKKLARIAIISDAAHSLGATYNNKKTGSAADVTIFSLHAVKNITTAEGGAIAFNLPKPFDNNELYNKLRLYTLNCQTKDAYTKSKAGGWKYDIVDLGMKINMPDINAAIGLGQIKIYNEMLNKRVAIFNKYLEGFSDCRWLQLPIISDDVRSSSCHLFPLRIKDIREIERDEIMQKITEYGISVNVHFIPLPMLTYFKSLGYNIKDYPITYSNYSSEISLPIYPQLEIKQVEYIIRSVKKAYASIKR